MTKALKARQWFLFKEWLPYPVQVGAQKTLCLLAGHDPNRDHCGRPEHDYCLWCNKSMPGAWRREA